MSIFDEMAARYDTPQRVQVANVIASALREKLTSCADKCAIDYGCGSGLVGLPLAARFGSMLLVDTSEPMVALVKEKIERLGLNNAETLCADFTDEIPIGLSADYILMTQLLLHIPDTENILRRMFSALRPGGHLLIVDFDKNEAVPSDRVHNGFVKADLIELMERIGYVNVSAKTFHEVERYFMNQDATLFLLEAEVPS